MRSRKSTETPSLAFTCVWILSCTQQIQTHPTALVCITPDATHLQDTLLAHWSVCVPNNVYTPQELPSFQGDAAVTASALSALQRGSPDVPPTWPGVVEVLVNLAFARAAASEVFLPVTTEVFAAHVEQESPSMQRIVSNIASKVTAVFADETVTRAASVSAGSEYRHNGQGAPQTEVPQSDHRLPTTISWAAVAARGIDAGAGVSSDISDAVPNTTGEVALSRRKQHQLAVLGDTLREATVHSKSYTEQLARWLATD
eukprot:m.1334805 g.1334805  ORF g.1334805 m.1334805 type:complete len:258 (+) comp24876_c0_seq4:64-837(+)